MNAGIQNKAFDLLPSSGHRGFQQPCSPAAAPSLKSAACVLSAAPGTSGGKVTAQGQQIYMLHFVFLHFLCFHLNI